MGSPPRLGCAKSVLLGINFSPPPPPPPLAASRRPVLLAKSLRSTERPAGRRVWSPEERHLVPGGRVPKGGHRTLSCMQPALADRSGRRQAQVSSTGAFEHKTRLVVCSLLGRPTAARPPPLDPSETSHFPGQTGALLLLAQHTHRPDTELRRTHTAAPSRPPSAFEAPKGTTNRGDNLLAPSSAGPTFSTRARHQATAAGGKLLFSPSLSVCLFLWLLFRL